MMTLDKKYRDELTLALRLHEISGERVGEVLAEVETHVAETGEAPEAAFGPPRAYAAQVASQLGVGPDKRSTANTVAGTLGVGALTYTGASLLLRGLFDGAVPIAALDLIVWVLMPVVLAGAIFVLFRGATAASNGRVYMVAGIGLVAMILVASGVLGAFNEENTLIELPSWAGIGIGAALLTVAVVVLTFATRRGRIVDPRTK